MWWKPSGFVLTKIRKVYCSLFIPISTSFPSSNFFILVLPHLELFLISLSCPCDTSASSSLTLNLYLTLTISPSSFVHVFFVHFHPSPPSIPHHYSLTFTSTSSSSRSIGHVCLLLPPGSDIYVSIFTSSIHPSAELHGMLVSPSPLFITSLHLFFWVISCFSQSLPPHQSCIFTLSLSIHPII